MSLATTVPRDLRLDLVHQFHGFDDAEHLAGLHGIAHFHERRGASGEGAS